jgi:hypothetical protein
MVTSPRVHSQLETLMAQPILRIAQHWTCTQGAHTKTWKNQSLSTALKFGIKRKAHTSLSGLRAPLGE